MNNLCKKLFALLLCAALCGTFTYGAFAAAPEPVHYYGSGSGVFTGDLSGLPFGKGEAAEPSTAGGSDGLEIYVVAGDVTGESLDILETTWFSPLTLKVTVSSTSGNHTLQWYKVAPENLSYNSSTDEWSWTYTASDKISKATKKSYKIASVQDEAMVYICEAKDKNGHTESVAFGVIGYYSKVNPSLSNAPNGVSVHWSTAGWYDTIYSELSGYQRGEHLYIASKYELYRKDGSKWTKLTTAKAKEDFSQPVPPPRTYEYVDKKAQMGKTYKYRIRYCMDALNDGAWLPWSDVQSITFNPFYDVSLDEERAQYIAWAYNNSVVKGDGAGHFNPDDPCTRMNFVMILWKMHGKPTVSGSNPFSDVSGTTSVNAVKWAVKKKLVTGTSATTFSPDSNLSRINIIMILYKLAGSPKASAESQYEDISGSKTSKAVNWAVGKGLISPVDETHFAPDANCSRALLVEILCKYNEIYKIL